MSWLLAECQGAESKTKSSVTQLAAVTQCEPSEGSFTQDTHVLECVGKTASEGRG